MALSCLRAAGNARDGADQDCRNGRGALKILPVRNAHEGSGTRTEAGDDACVRGAREIIAKGSGDDYVCDCGRYSWDAER